MKNSLRNKFLLDPSIHFLNHGSFGACPAPVFEDYQRWQRKLEFQPVKFLGRDFENLMQNARTGLAEFLSCNPEDVVFFPNATTAINMVIKNLKLAEGDEILATNHEYTAMDKSWRHYCLNSGAIYKNQSIPLPLPEPEDFVDLLWQGVTPRTKIIFLSHITSQTALKFPVELICKKARKEGIITIIDGAHAPGQIPLNLEDIGADIYTGACHKWMCAPKGSAFLYARKDIQSALDPLVVSWGYESENPSSSQFIDYHEWQGTRDFSAFLTVPAAIKFMDDNDWGEVQQSCSKMVNEVRDKINQLTGYPSFITNKSILQLATVQLPDIDPAALQKKLYDQYKVEVPIFLWEKIVCLRYSIQGYNTQNDIDALIEGLAQLLPKRE